MEGKSRRRTGQQAVCREQDMEKEKIGKYIREKRTRLGMTQQQLADRIQVTEKAVSRWETGRGAPDISLLEPLAVELQVSIAELLNGEDRRAAEEDKNREEAGNSVLEQTEQAVGTVIAYVQENRKKKYNAGFVAGVICFGISFLWFLLYLRNAYRFAGNYFGSLFRVVAASGTFLAGEAVMEHFYLEKLEEKRKGRQAGLWVLFLYYAVMLFNLTFLERTEPVTGYQLIPFRTISAVLRSGDTYATVINIFGNFLIFMPLGFFLMELFHVVEGKKYLAVSILITAGVEILQFITKTGVLDVDDMVLCVGGMVTFFYIYKMWRGRWRCKTDRQKGMGR